MHRSNVLRVPGSGTYMWLAARARNVLRRPALVGAAGGVGFVVVLVALVIIPREASRAARAVAAQVDARPDTTTLSATRDRARRQIMTADSVLSVARSAPSIMPQAVDTLSPAMASRRDSLSRELAALNRALVRAQNSPLAASYRTLAETPAMRGNANVRALLDSLNEIEREREEFGAVGGADPVYVALTSRATAIGRAIQTIAEAKQAELRTSLAPLLPVVPRAVMRAPEDTMRYIAQRIAAQTQLIHAERGLAVSREKNTTIDRELQRARELANMGAPPLAMLAAAAVVALAIGFGVAFTAELHIPRVADVREAEQVAGVRVLTVIEPAAFVSERHRRHADIVTPPLIEVVSDNYRKLYLHLAATESNIPIVTVTGDDPAVVATVAANLAAAAAHEARGTLLVDVDSSTSAVASVLRIRSNPGLAGVLSDQARWAEAIVSTTIGRDRPLDVVPSGTGRPTAMNPHIAERIRSDFARLERRYEFIVLAAPTSYVQLTTTSIIPAPDVVLCIRAGHTAIRDLRTALGSLRGAARTVHGVVIWDDELPRLTPLAQEMEAIDSTSEVSVTRRTRVKAS
jgi:Mrp family chromosome partitioning ATPase